MATTSLDSTAAASCTRSNRIGVPGFALGISTTGVAGVVGVGVGVSI